MFKDRYEKVKLHLRENKKYYFIGAGCFVAGATTVLVFRRADIVTKNVSLLSYKPVQSNTVIVSLARRGHPGNLVRCVETGEVFASQNRAAQALGLGAGNLANHLNAKLPHVKGLHFERMGEAVA